MTDVEAGTTKDGKVITTGYGAAPASVEAIPGNTPEKKTQSWATSAAYIFGFLVLVIGGMLLYDHFMVDTEAPAAPPVVAHHVAPPALAPPPAKAGAPRHDAARPPTAYPPAARSPGRALKGHHTRRRPDGRAHPERFLVESPGPALHA